MIRDILDFVKDIKDIDSYVDDNDSLTLLPNLKKLSKTSIARRSSDMIMQFPVLISKSVSVDEMLMISKALEREYVTFLRICCGIDDIITDENFSKEKYVRKLHQNVGGKTSVLGTVQEIFRESNEKLLEPYENMFNPSVLNEMAGTQYSGKTARMLSEAGGKINKKQFEDQLAHSQGQGPTNTAPARFGGKTYDSSISAQHASRTSEMYLSDKMARERDMTKAQHDVNMERLRNANSVNSEREKAVIRMNNSRDRHIGSAQSKYTNQLVDNDVRKANEMVPTMMDVEVTVIQKGVAIPVRILIGAKTINHPIDSEEMVYNIAKSMKDKRVFFRTIQWTTGEIKFLKDFILNIEGMRKEALQNKGGSNLWHIFKNRAKLDKMRRFSFSKNQLLPNGTICITRDEADMILNMHGIDLMDSKTAQRMLDIFFLLGFVIVDPGAELAYFLFDGQNNFQTFSYSALEKESGSGSTELKKIINLMNRVR